MSSVKDVFMGEKKPQAAPTTNPTNAGQLNSAYGQTQTGLNQAQDYYSQAAGQNGFQNQSNVYNQLQGVANGQGANPALAQLNETTRQNVNNQAALMASQRGSSANPGMVARQAAMQGAGIQQQAAGQAATMSAQQQLAAMQAMGNIANTQVGQQYQGLGMYNQAAQNEQANLLGAQGNFNNVSAGMQGNINNNNATLIGSGLSALGGGASGVAAAMMARGGPVPAPAPKNFAMGGPTGGSFSDYLSSNTSAQQTLPLSPLLEGGSVNTSNTFNDFASAGKLAGKAYKNRNQNQGPPGVSNDTGPAMGGDVYASKGMKVPGKASVKGDSLKNDTVPAMLSPGEVVIPRHIMQSKDPINNSAKFVAAILAKQHKGQK